MVVVHSISRRKYISQVVNAIRCRANCQASMYSAAAEAMNIQQHQGGRGNHHHMEDEDVVGGESIENPQIQYNQHLHQNGGSVEGGGGVEEMWRVTAHSMYALCTEVLPVASSGVVGGPAQLMLSFQGEVYEIKDVSLEKGSIVMTRPVLSNSSRSYSRGLLFSHLHSLAALLFGIR